MSDDWEDWENENFSIPTLTIKSAEELKKLQERRLVEESDNKIARQLFGYDDEEEDKYKIINTSPNLNISINSIRNKKSTVSNQKENEAKIKEKAKKIKEEKAKKINEKDKFGEADEDEDEYDYYAYKFDN